MSSKNNRRHVFISHHHNDDHEVTKLTDLAVYNAGSQSIILDRSQRLFLIWFSSLDRTTADLYEGTHQNQILITSEDISRIQGEIASPAALKKSFEALRLDYLKAMAELKSEYTKQDLGLGKRGFALEDHYSDGISQSCSRDRLNTFESLSRECFAPSGCNT